MFCVFIDENIETRYKVDIPNTEVEFYDFIKSNIKMYKDGVNSGDFIFLDCKFLDIYY